MTDFMTPERLAAFTDESIDEGEYCPQDVFDLRDALLAAWKERHEVNSRLVEAITDLIFAAEPCMVTGQVIRRAKEDNSILTVEMDIDRLLTLAKVVKKVADDCEDLIVDEVTRRALEFVNGDSDV